MKILAQNKTALFNYDLVEKYTAGLILLGWEVKSIKGVRVSLKESYVVPRNGRLFLVGAHVNKWPGAVIGKNGEYRDRELLLKKSEVKRLEAGVKVRGHTITPLDLHLERGKVKLTIALAKGKKLYDKRAKLKEEDQKRELERDLKKMNVLK
jgi:SsrA-binding protein